MAQYLAHHQVRINEAGENEFSVSEGTRALCGGPIVAGWLSYIPLGIEVLSAGAASTAMSLPIP